MRDNVFKCKPDILVVDDMPEYIDNYIRLLGEKGCSVRVAKTGKDGLAEVEKKLPDLILLDVAMPGMNGFEVCTVIRGCENFGNIPIIFMIVDNDVNSIVQGFKAGGQDYLTKPLNEIEFILKIENHLKLKFMSENNDAELKDISESTDGKMLFDEIFESINISAHDVFENTVDGIVVTGPEGEILYLNKFAEQIIGWEQKDVIGKAFEEIFHLFEGDPCNKAPNPVKKAIETRKVVGLAKNTLLLTKNKEYIYLSAGISTIQDRDEKVKAVVIVFRDISRLRRREINVEENERKYRALFNNTLDAIFVSLVMPDNELGKIIEVNDAACRWTGFSREELLNMEITDLMKVLKVESSSYSNTGMVNYAMINAEAGVIKKNQGILDNNKVYFESSIHYFTLNNQKIALSINHDVTSFRVAQEQMLQAKKIAEEANKTKSIFLANMSHEIRTPLNGIIGMSDLMLRVKMTPEEQRETTKTIISCSQNLLHLLNNILDFSKIEAEKVEISSNVFDLKEIIGESINMYKIRAKEKSLDISAGFQDGLENLWIGDKVKIQQILNNLINNAIKFTIEGRINVLVNKLNDDGSCCELQFTVSDTGIGIEDKDLNKLFVAFSQVDGSYTRQFGGTGLGLSISKKLVELMGGRIWVESTMGVGSRFNFTLKLTKANDSEKHTIKKQSDLLVAKKDGLRGKKVLLVDEEKVNQQLFIKIADFCMIETDVANNGLEAVDAVKDQFYDLILMDIQMPVMDGIEATKKIREYQETRGMYTPIIAVTANALQGDREKFIALGMDDYLAKPYTVEELLSVIAGKIDEKTDVSNDISFSKLVLGGIDKADPSKNGNWKSNDAKEYCERLQAAILERDQQNAEKYSHLIKEMAANSGFDDVKYAAFGIEIEVRKRNFAEAEVLIKELINLFIAIRE